MQGIYTSNLPVTFTVNTVISLPASFVAVTMYVPPSLGVLTGLRVNVDVLFGGVISVVTIFPKATISPFRVQTMLVMGRLNPVIDVLITRFSPTTTSTDWSGDKIGATVEGQLISDSFDTVECN